MSIFRLVIASVFMLILGGTAVADYTVTGQFLYEDPAFNAKGFTGSSESRPIRFADVSIVAAGTIVANGATGADGKFSFLIKGSQPQTIQAVCYASSTNTPGLQMEIRSTNTNFAFGSIYSFSGSSSDTNLKEIRAVKGSSAGKVFNMWDVAYDGMEFVASSNAAGSLPTEMLTVLWSSSGYGGSFYSYNIDSKTQKKSRYIHIGAASGYDDAVIEHQFGHFVADLYSKLDAPLPYVPFLGVAGDDIRAAWAEGLGMFIGASIRKYKGYDHPEAYVVTDGTNLVFSIDIGTLTGATPIATRGGSTNLFAVCAALWNVTNGTLQRPFTDVWRVLTTYLPTVTSAGISVEDFWDGWFSSAINNGALTQMQTIFSSFGIEFAADAQEADDSVSTAPTVTVAPLSLATGPKVLINEIILGTLTYLGSTAYRVPPVVELYNAGDTEADLTGWTVTASTATSTSTTSALLTIPSFKLKPGAFVYLTEGSSPGSASALFFANTTIPWLTGLNGACALRDSDGQAKDFVRWGDSKEFPPGSLTFAGPNPPSATPGRSLGRNYAGANTNSGADWTLQDPSIGTFNASGQGKHHTFYPAGDIDYVAFNATAGRTYVLETLNLTSAADTILELLNPDGTAVVLNGAQVANDDHANTKASRIVWQAPSTGKYLLRARRYDGVLNYAQYGSYDLQIIECASALPPEKPSVLTVSKSGQLGTYQTITDAISAAGYGDTIQIMDSETYRENLQITGRGVILKADPGAKPVLDGRGSSSSPTISVSGVKSATIQGFTIIGSNSGIVVSGGAAAKIIDMIVNRATSTSTSDGIAIIGSGTKARVVHSTVVNNRQGGVAVYGLASAEVVNSIVRSNTVLDVGGDTQNQWILSVKNSDVPKSTYVGKDGNINTDPKFVNATTDDYHLQQGSPCIDTGLSSDADMPAYDADGFPRSLDGNGDGTAVPDMGAYEYVSSSILTATAVFPQIAVGGPADGEYRTAIYGMNTAAQALIANVSTIDNNGAPLPVTLPSGSGSSFTIVIPPSGTVRLETSGTATTVPGYAKFASTLPMSGSALFKILSGGSRIVSEAGVGLSRPTKYFTIYIDYVNSAASGFAIANSGSATANLTLTLRDKTGAQVGDPLGLPPIPAGQHLSRFAHEVFGIDRVPAGFEGSIDAVSDQSVSAVALRYDNVSPPYSISTIPVLVDEFATVLYFPQVADGGGYRTNVILVNPGTGAATARLEFFDDKGAPMALPIQKNPVTYYDVTVPAKGVARVITDGSSSGTRVGWVKVSSPLPLGGSSIFQTVSGSTITSEAGVASSPLAAHFTTFVQSSTSPLAQSGLAIANPNNAAVTITLNLRDSDGNVVATTSFQLGPQAHVAKFFNGAAQWFTGHDQFEGTLEVVATGQVSGVALRYDNDDNQVFATLPVVAMP